MAIRTGAEAADTTALDERIQAVHDLALQAEETGQNAREMVLRRDAKLDAAAADATTAVTESSSLKEIAASYAAALPASVADRAALHQAIDALQLALTAEVRDRAAADAAEEKARKAVDDALAGRAGLLEAAVAVLQKTSTVVAFGTANLPASLAAGAGANVVVTLSKSMGSASYSTGYALAGGASLLGNIQAVSVVAQTATTVTVAVKNTGLTAVLNLAAASVSVVAARDVVTT